MKIYKGKIVSIKNNKTLTVEVERFLSHPLYKKRYKRNKRYQVHSENEYPLETVVKFVETRPLSKTKRWRVLEEKAKKSEEKKETKVVVKKSVEKKKVRKAEK